jgi:uncharacterized protein
VAGAAARGNRAPHRSERITSNPLQIRSDAAKGRCVFATAPIPAGTVIEAAPVVIVPPEQRSLLDKTILHDYYFQWDDGPEDTGRGAVALGLVSLCNHSRRPNARAQRNPARCTLDLIALAPIAAGEEITIDYKCTLWFEPRE